MPPPLPDYHVHTPYCGHARGEMRDYVAAAVEQGLPEMGFADHLPLFHLEDPTLAMPHEDLPRYVESVLKLRQSFPGLPLRLGIEADYVEEHVEDLAELLSRYDFDYVYGSVHFISGWGFDQARFKYEFERRDIDEVYEAYFRLVIDAAGTGLFDVMTHLDVVKKYGHRPRRDLTPIYHELGETLAAGGVAVELNSSGLRKPVGEIYPTRELLEVMHAHRVPITFGSDAHKPGDVGRDFDRLLELARAAGYREYVRLGRKERRTVPLPS